ncbi:MULTISPECIES: MFS transporter [unclassified Rhizobium]|jgi:predicted MFS family arabinose efflux permease|uniref:MFS transporter n=1 Tax=unclassified Rhizobium TaxID=2613769 RepID=UPI00068F4B2E|nr:MULTISPECIES: MFS transporter [unclassified Rhizobium]MBN8953955.1 MFS transporter [Rhizobium tropici]RKD50955.1 putative MFS family arabinose efflux permease [Rhizobium sp. WW_1]
MSAHSRETLSEPLAMALAHQGIEAEEPIEPPATTASWAALVAIGVGAFALVTTEFLPVGLLPQIASDMTVTEGQAGLAVTMSGLFAATAAPISIWIAGSLDRRKVLLFLLGILLIANLIVAMAPSFLMILLGRVLLGATIGAFWTIAGPLGPRLKPGPKAGLATAIILSGVSLGTVAGVPVGALIGELVGWRYTFGLSAIVAVLVLVAIALLVPPLPVKSSGGLGDLYRVFKNPMVRFGLVGIFLSFVGQFAGYTYIAPFLLKIVRVDPPTVSAVLFGFGLVGVAGNILGGWAVGKSLRWATAGTLTLLGTSVLLLILLGSYPAAAIPLILVWGLGFGMQPIVIQNWMFNAAPDQLEGVQAILVSAAQTSIGSGALIGGLLFDQLGLKAAFAAAAVTAFLTAAMFAALKPSAAGR